ncbi:MAG: hypothetical protein ABW023_04215 [Sphingomonas sp.]
MEAKLGIGLTARQTAMLVSRNPVPGVIALLVPIGMGTAFDAVPGSDARMSIFLSIASVFAQFLLTSAILRGEGRHHAWGKPGRAASFVGLGIVTGLAIGFGFLLLGVPGLFLFARWIATTPLVVGEGMTMGEAMQVSWQRTRFGTIAIMTNLILILIPGLGALLVMIFGYPEYGPVPVTLAIASNLLLYASLVMSWYLAIAVHILTDSVEAEEVA